MQDFSKQYCDFMIHTYAARILRDTLESKIKETCVFFWKVRTDTITKTLSVREFDDTMIKKTDSKTAPCLTVNTSKSI